jgi:ubiquinone/menaquinone biosynthesis C-methylase UbiE
MNYGHAEVTDWGLAKITVGKQDHILDIGCGGGETIHKLAGMTPDGTVYGIDLSEESIRVASMRNRQLVRYGRVVLHQGSVSSLPFPDCMFDLVTAVETHYFWPDLASDLEEIQRVLKPGGLLAIIGESYSGSKNAEKDRKWIECGNMAWPDVEELKNLLSKAGYAQLNVTEEYEKGWICAVGKKPHRPA